MHAEEVETDAALVRRLLARQFPRWADLPITLVASHGTDHDIYRVGGRLVARLPRIGWASGQPAKKVRWLPHLARRLPLAVPVPVAVGEPDAGYPFPWAVCEWLPGDPAHGPLEHPEQAAVDLARSLEAPVPDGPEVWIHGDLLPGNLLVVDGRLSAVIDWGGLTVGDPACDLQPAWTLFRGSSRVRFLAGMGRRRGPAARARLGPRPGRDHAALLPGDQSGDRAAGPARAGRSAGRGRPPAVRAVRPGRR